MTERVMPSPQDGASPGPDLGAAAPVAEAFGSALSGALGASSAGEYSDAGTDRGAGLSGVLGSGSATGVTAEKMPRWKGKRIGRYRLVDLLGKGSYGRVFVADDVDLHRKVALKIVSAESTAASLRNENQSPPATGTGAQPPTGTLASQTGTGAATTEHIESLAAKVVEKTLSEARAAARLEHPNVVHVYEVGRLPAPVGTPPGTVLGGFIAMELLEGGTLHDHVKANGPMNVARACSLVADAAEALQFAHDQGVVHRDLKPANLMLSRHGRCKVVDFGLAMEHDPDGANKIPIAGTLMFVAPEVTLGKPPGPKSDQYSLGVTLWALLAARPPYTGNKQQLLDGHRHGAPPSLRAIRPDVPESLELAILRAMEKDPERRFHTIRQFGQTLRTFSGEATAADAGASYLPDLFADLDDPKAPEAPAKPSAPPPVFADPQIAAAPKVAARAPVVRPPVLSGPGLPAARRAPVARQGTDRPVIWPWMAGAAAAVLALLSLIVWAVNSRSGSNTQVALTPQQTTYDQPRPPVRPAPGQNSNPSGAGQQPTNQQQPGAAPVSQQQQPQPSTQTQPPPVQPVTPPQQPQQQQQTPPESAGSGPPDVPPKQPTGSGNNPPANLPGGQPKQTQAQPGVAPAGGGSEPAEAPPAVLANQELLAAFDFVNLVRIANGADEQRPDKRAAVEGKVAVARPTPDGMLRLEFAGPPRRSLVVQVDLNDEELLKALQEKFASKAKHLGAEGKTVIVRGAIALVGGAPTILITSADQLDAVPPGKERFPAGGPQHPGGRPGAPRPSGRN